jgi:hypothetical protein
MFLRSSTTLAAICALVIGVTASAAVVPGIYLGADKIVAAFNGANNGNGVYFQYANETLGRASTLFKSEGGYYEFADISAYVSGLSRTTAPGGIEIFYTFCVEKNVTAPSLTRAYLNYDAKTGTTMTANTQQFLSVGGAYLYAHWALGTLDGFNYDTTTESDHDVLRESIRGFVSSDPVNPNDYFVQVLLTINDDLAYWTQAYNPDALYEEIGEYCVFVMNTQHSRIDGTSYQNLLYLAKGTPHAPEPMTMALLAVGGLAVLKRRKQHG